MDSLLRATSAAVTAFVLTLVLDRLFPETVAAPRLEDEPTQEIVTTPAIPATVEAVTVVE